MRNLYTILTITLSWIVCLTGHAFPSNTSATGTTANASTTGGTEINAITENSEETETAAESSEQTPELRHVLPVVPRPVLVHPEPLPRHQITPQDFSIAEIALVEIELPDLDDQQPDTAMMPWARAHMHRHEPPTIYAMPASWTLNVPNWKRLWTNTAVLGGAYVTAMGVLECLPEGSTNWNKKEIQSVPFYKRWWRHVIKEGPEWDGDSWIFNFVLHPYAGAVYFMAARSNGFNFYRSLLYSACVSTIGWEFGVEGIMERPSIQDIFITPLVGSIMGEGFYRIKRYIVHHDYHLWGSALLGNIVAFIVDPVNEVVGLFNGNPARRYAATLSLTPSITAHHVGFSLLATF